MDPTALRIVISSLAFLAVFIAVRYGHAAGRQRVRRQVQRYDRLLNYQLLMSVSAPTAVTLSYLSVVVGGLLGAALIGGLLPTLVGATVGFFVPGLVLRHLEQKRRERLEEQLVDAIATLASGVRAGLNLVQAMELLVKNTTGPIRQEFSQLLREYQMGLELNQAMHNAANRIGSGHYRLLFTAIEMHRQRGGDTGESLDRIAESIREIQRLEGRLEALTAQGRAQARMMGLAPLVLLGILYTIDPEGVGLLFSDPIGRMVLLGAAALIAAGFVWIRRILSIDI